mgnify:CR=1 FL=1
MRDDTRSLAEPAECIKGGRGAIRRHRRKQAAGGLRIDEQLEFGPPGPAAVIGERAIGFAELSLRDDLETFGKRLVAYVEGVFVEPDWRGQGVGLALLEAAGHWARVKSVQELVSDVLADNDVSVAFHQRAGFWRVGETLASGKRQVLLARRVGDQ